MGPLGGCQLLNPRRGMQRYQPTQRNNESTLPSGHTAQALPYGSKQDNHDVSRSRKFDRSGLRTDIAEQIRNRGRIESARRALPSQRGSRPRTRYEANFL
jgi:hypothetical protein